MIVIEGADGCGKDTVADAVARLLTGSERLNFPNDKGVTGPMIRAYLNRRWHIQEDFQDAPLRNPYFDALAFQALQVANRMEVMPRLLDASLNEPEGPVVVLARYWQSGWVYGQLDGLDPEFLLGLHKAMAVPHLNVLLDVPADVCMARRAARDGVKTERYEGKLDFTAKVVDLYRRLWAQQSEAPSDLRLGERWLMVDATRPVEDVIDEVTAAAGDLLIAQGLRDRQ